MEEIQERESTFLQELNHLPIKIMAEMEQAEVQTKESDGRMSMTVMRVVSKKSEWDMNKSELDHFYNNFYADRRYTTKE